MKESIHSPVQETQDVGKEAARQQGCNANFCFFSDITFNDRPVFVTIDVEYCACPSMAQLTAGLLFSFIT